MCVLNFIWNCRMRSFGKWCDWFDSNLGYYACETCSNGCRAGVSLYTDNKSILQPSFDAAVE